MKSAVAGSSCGIGLLLLFGIKVATPPLRHLDDELSEVLPVRSSPPCRPARLCTSTFGKTFPEKMLRAHFQPELK